MDSYSGSEPRKFISFHLGKENIGQPQQPSCEPESIANPEQSASNETPAIESTELSISPATEVDQEVTQPQQSPSPSLVFRFFATDSSGSNESCETYITCRLNQLAGKIALETSEVTEFSQKESISEAITLTPSVQHYEYSQLERSSCHQVLFLDSPKEAGTSGCPEPEALAAKKPRMTPPQCSSAGTDIPADPTAAVSDTWRQTASDSEGEQIEIEPPFANYSSSEIGHLSDNESDRYVGSTLAEALNPPAQYSLLVASDQSSDVATVKTPEEPKVRPLGGSSRALIKKYFGNNEPERLPPGHPVFAFTEGQLGSVLRVVADETARASYDMLENLVYRASRLSLSTKAGANSGKGRTSSRQGSSVDSSRSRRTSSITGKGSDTSGVLRNDDDFSSIGYSFEHSEPEHIAAAPRPTQPSSSRDDPGSPMVTFSADSPGIQTLAELKKEAVHDR